MKKKIALTSIFKCILLFLFIGTTVLIGNCSDYSSENSTGSLLSEPRQAGIPENTSPFSSIKKNDSVFIQNIKKHAAETKQIIVKLTAQTYSKMKIQDSQTVQAYNNALKNLNLVEKRVLQGRCRVLKMQDSNKATLDVIKELLVSKLFEYAQPDYYRHIATTPNDPSFNQLWGMQTINAPKAWDLSTGSGNVIVAVIDTGVDYNHPDLKNNMWRNPSEIAGNGIDDDGNGYVDDYYGINAITKSGNPMDDHNHGTHCSGILGAVGNNSVGVVGVNWTVHIMALKFLDSTGNGSDSDAITCVDYAIANKANVMSNSWGGTEDSPALQEAVARAQTAGLLFVVASGNSTANIDVIPFYPAAWTNENIISVASIDSNEGLSSFSNYGPRGVDVAAPGSSILSTTRNNTYGQMSGTSMACPHVAGLCALYKAKNPSVDWKAIKDRVLGMVKKTNSLNGKILTGGIINAFSTLDDSSPTPPPDPTPNPDPTPDPPAVAITAPESYSLAMGNVTITADANDAAGITRVEFFVGTTKIGESSSAPYTCTWNSATAETGLQDLTAVAYNGNGQFTTSGAVVVFVFNFPGNPIPPSPSPDPNPDPNPNPNPNPGPGPMPPFPDMPPFPPFPEWPY